MRHFTNEFVVKLALLGSDAMFCCTVRACLKYAGTEAETAVKRNGRWEKHPGIMPCSVKFYVIRTMCCTVFFLLSLPSHTVTLSDLMYMMEYSARAPLPPKKAQTPIFVCCGQMVIHLSYCWALVLLCCGRCRDSNVLPARERSGATVKTCSWTNPAPAALKTHTTETLMWLCVWICF